LLCHHLAMVTGITSSATIPEGRPTRPRQGPFTRWPRSSDAVLAVAVFLLEVVGILARATNEAGEFDMAMLGDVAPATYLLLAASSIALLWRRSSPLIVLAATLIASIVWDVLRLADGPSLAIFVSLYGVGRYIEEDSTSLTAVAAALTLVAVDDLLIEAEPASVAGFSLVLVFAAWYLGRRIKGRGEYLALVEERAEYLERERAAEAQRAVDEERTRIARELHDLVAHRVSMMTVQAGAAQTVAVSDPDRAIRAMGAVEEAGREALDELRQVLGVLRADQQGEALGPMHGLADIPGLVAEMRGAGMDVSLSKDGVPGDLPARVDLASYRIVQEALTNVLKHAGRDAEAEVRLSSENQMLKIEVVDRGTGTSSLPGSGQGLVGMRERAALLGGTFEAGPRPAGGFRIMALLPMERGRS
jgi:signal transduction histidine kinase